MSMYAEERQQAMAQLVDRARPAVGQRARRAVRRHHRDGAPRPVRPGADGPGAAGPRRRRPGQHRWPRSSPALVERDSANTAEKDRIARAALALLPPPGSTVLIDAGSTTSPAGQPAPPRPPPDRRDPRRPGRGPARRPLPQIELHLLPGPGPLHHAGRGRGRDRRARSRSLRADVAFLGTNGITVDHGLSTPDRDEAATKRAMVASARQVVVLADADKIGAESPIRFAALDEVDVLVTDDADRRRRPSTRLDARRHRGRGRMIVTLTANPSHDRTVTLAGPLERGAVHPHRVGDLAGGRQGRQHLPRRGGGRHAVDRRAARLPRTTRSSSSCSPPASTAARSPRRATSGSTSRSPSPTARPPS